MYASDTRCKGDAKFRASVSDISLSLASSVMSLPLVDRVQAGFEGMGAVAGAFGKASAVPLDRRGLAPVKDLSRSDSGRSDARTRIGAGAA